MDATETAAPVPMPAFYQVERAIAFAWKGDLSVGQDFPGVLPERLRNLAAQPMTAKPLAADAVRAAAVGLGIHP